MKNRIKAFLRLRKQSDIVKIICICVLASTVFLIRILYYAGEIYHYINTPAEYVLTGEGAVSQKRMDELLACEGVTGASRQMDVPAVIMYHGAETEITCTMLSEEYMEEVLHAGSLAGTRKIIMNKAGMEQLQQSLWEHSGGMTDETGAEQTGIGSGALVRWFMAEPEDDSGESGGEDAARRYKTARLMEVQSEEEEGFACIADIDNRLLKEAVSIRVQFGQHDLDGLQAQTLRAFGYVIENEKVLMEQEHEMQINLLHIQYGLLCFIICLTGGGVLSHWRDAVFDFK